MAYPTMDAVAALQALLSAEDGLAASVAALQARYDVEPAGPFPVEVGLVRAPAELQEKAGPSRYPVIQTYCDQIESKRSERFRLFSGRMRVVTEVRVSADRLERVPALMHLYVDAVRDVVERRAGCVADGVFLEPGYEVVFEAVKRGGLQYSQTGRVVCWVGVNR